MGDLYITIEERVVLFTDVHNYYGISHALGADAYWASPGDRDHRARR